MRKYGLSLTAVTVLATSMFAIQNESSMGVKGPMGDGMRSEMKEKRMEMKQENFAEVKMKLLARMAENKTCVEKSTNFEQLKACKPTKEERMKIDI